MFEQYKNEMEQQQIAKSSAETVCHKTLRFASKMKGLLQNRTYNLLISLSTQILKKSNFR